MLTANNSKGGPQPDRPYIAESGYGIPTSLEETLPWSHVTERMEQARNYWIGTVGPEGRPHAVPVWGVWVEGTLYFGGGPQTRWSRNLAASSKSWPCTSTASGCSRPGSAFWASGIACLRRISKSDISVLLVVNLQSVVQSIQ